MKKLLLLLLLTISIGCASPQVISTPPDAFHPQRATTDKELISQWQVALIRIKEWQAWYDIQVGSNYFYRHSPASKVSPTQTIQNKNSNQ